MAIRTAATGPSPARRFAGPYAPSELRLPVSGSAGQSRPPCRIPPRPNAAALLACCLQVTLNLSPALLAVVLEEQRQTKPGEIRNLDFAPLWASQDPAGVCVGITPGKRDGEVRVSLRYPASTVELEFKMKLQGNQWLVDDILYPDPLRSLKAILQGSAQRPGG